MYLYFDNAGNLKEIINDIPLRVGNNNVNEVYLYWDGYDSLYTTMRVNYTTPDEITSTKTINISTSEGTYVLRKQIPPNDKRDLYFFKYGKYYDFIKFTISTQALLLSGLLKMGFELSKVGGEFTLDTVNLMVSGSHDIKPQEHCSIADYYDLLGALGGKQNVLTAGNGVNIVGTTISADYTNTTFINLLKGLLTPTIIDQPRQVDSEGKITFTYSGEYKLAILTFGNTFTILPLYNLTGGTTYKTSGTFVYDIIGNVKTTTINFKYEEGTDTLTIWSGDRNYGFVENYTAYLFGITLY